MKEYLNGDSFLINPKKIPKQNSSRARSSFDEYEMKNIFSSNLTSRETSVEKRQKLLSRDFSREQIRTAATKLEIDLSTESVNKDMEDISHFYRSATDHRFMPDCDPYKHNPSLKEQAE